jgi:hypothetical protein
MGLLRIGLVRLGNLKRASEPPTVLGRLPKQNQSGAMGFVSFPRSLHRWLWFAALYAAGVGTLAVVAYGLRALLMVLE